jgi:hypothetical protein
MTCFRRVFGEEKGNQQAAKFRSGPINIPFIFRDLEGIRILP